MRAHTYDAEVCLRVCVWFFVRCTFDISMDLMAARWRLTYQRVLLT